MLHGKDLIFSLIAHKSDDASFGSVRESYLKIHDAVRGAFETFGLKPVFVEGTENSAPAPGSECFINPLRDSAWGVKVVCG